MKKTLQTHDEKTEKRDRGTSATFTLVEMINTKTNY